MNPQIQSSLAIEGLSGGGGEGVKSEASVVREMQNQGMQSPGTGTGGDASGFGDFLTRVMSDVNRDQMSADSAVKELISGRSKNIHETMLTIEKADLSLKMMMQVRNKVLEAYREIMKIQV